MMVPVNLRGHENPNELGNRISLVPVTIPLDIRDPRKLLTAVHQRTEFLKYSHAAELVSLAGGMIGMFPTSLQSMIGPALSQLPVTPFNLVCTNVPGPQFPLYLLGHKMLTWYPYVPVGGEMSANCAILSYNGTVFFGFSADTHAVPDLRRFEKLLQESFHELRAATVERSPQKQRKKTGIRNRNGASAKTIRMKPLVTAPVTIPTPVSNFIAAKEQNAVPIADKNATQLSA
jgi:diacylglycerol O-acyltransferase